MWIEAYMIYRSTYVLSGKRLGRYSRPLIHEVLSEHQQDRGSIVEQYLDLSQLLLHACYSAVGPDFCNTTSSTASIIVELSRQYS